MFATVSLNFNEVEKINLSEVEESLSEKDFGILDESGQPPDHHYIAYHVFKPLNRTPMILLSVGIYEDVKNETKSAYLTIIVSRVFPESQIESEKQKVINEVKQIATICNLTIDWNNVQWNISYQD